tara:strand:+ start:3736 stop:5244 length:1509 start_codon:yes stop_codon:yes gene_type:complete
MIKVTTLILLLFVSFIANAQSIDAPFSKEKMKKDFEVFKNISITANSGLKKYRSEKQIDSIYNWANQQIEKITTYREFYNLISTITDFEGSCHNEIALPKKYATSLKNENYGYFPYPIQWVAGKWVVNISDKELPLGAEIMKINEVPISTIIPALYKYYSTDGFNLTGKRTGLMTSFSKYYRLHFGLTKTFTISYLNPISKELETKTVQSVGNKTYYENFRKMHSMSIEQYYYANLRENQKYKYKQLNPTTGILTIHTFDIGDEKTNGHKKYKSFLDSIFTNIKASKIVNLIVDVRNNGGGNDPNDLVTYSYLTDRNFQENKQAWITFKKIPLLQYYKSAIPKFIRPLVVGKFNKEFQTIFSKEKDGKYYQDDNAADHKIITPNPNAFNGKIYLLTSPKIASAGSLFASMVAGNINTITIGEETLGGYYGHNGHTPVSYKLPKSKIEITFSVVNLEQDVPKKENQKYGRGIIPNYEITQTFDDYINNTDTQLNFTMDLISKQ